MSYSFEDDVQLSDEQRAYIHWMQTRYPIKLQDLPRYLDERASFLRNELKNRISSFEFDLYDMDDICRK